MLADGSLLLGIDVAKEAIKPYLSYVKDCASYTSFGNCWSSNAKLLDKSGAAGQNAFSGLVLKDGSSLLFAFGQGTSGTCTWAITAEFAICGYIIVDVNGPVKGPNIEGRDIYELWVTKDGVLPLGCMQDGRLATCSTNGQGCSAKYLME